MVETGLRLGGPRSRRKKSVQGRVERVAVPKPILEPVRGRENERERRDEREVPDGAPAERSGRSRRDGKPEVSAAHGGARREDDGVGRVLGVRQSRDGHAKKNVVPEIELLPDAQNRKERRKRPDGGEMVGACGQVPVVREDRRKKEKRDP